MLAPFSMQCSQKFLPSLLNFAGSSDLHNVPTTMVPLIAIDSRHNEVDAGDRNTCIGRISSPVLSPAASQHRGPDQVIV